MDQRPAGTPPAGFNFIDILHKPFCHSDPPASGEESWGIWKDPSPPSGGSG